MLIDEDIVGENCSNFKFTFEKLMNSAGERLFSDMNTAEFFRQTEVSVKSKWGADVIPIFVILNTDKTHVTRLGQLKVWPFNIAIGNLTTEVLESKRGSRLAGYCPMMPISDQSLAVYLNAVGIRSKTAQDSACKMQRRKLEQDYIESILEPIKNLEESGPILYRIGGASSAVYRCMVKVIRYICKNPAFLCIVIFVLF